VSRLARWFLPEEPDVLGTLRLQARVTLEGMEAFATWSERGDEDQARAVRDAEHRADDVRRELLEQLSAALTTPVDQEDVYWLSERLDAVMNAAKTIVREAEVLEIRPDEHTGAMGASALEAARRLNDSFLQLAVKEEHQATKRTVRSRQPAGSSISTAWHSPRFRCRRTRRSSSRAARSTAATPRSPMPSFASRLGSGTPCSR
jgi:hypothetical protein